MIRSQMASSQVDDMYRRLNVVSVQLEELGLTDERNVDVLLRRLANTKDIGPLKLLVSLVEPVKEYRRGEQRPSTMLSPLTGFVDAAKPDSESGRRLRKSVDEFLSDAPRFQLHAMDLEKTFKEWRDSQLGLAALIDRSSALHEVKPLVSDVRNLSDAGLEALNFITSGQTPPPEWSQTKSTLLIEAAKPKGAVELVVVMSVQQLVTAATELSQLKTMSSAEWKKHVSALVSGSAR
jgi:hexosaminidase